MILSVNIVVFPSTITPVDFEQNGIDYRYKLVMELNDKNLWAEVLHDSTNQIAYLEPSELDEPNQLLMGHKLSDFIRELNLISEDEEIGINKLEEKQE